MVGSRIGNYEIIAKLGEGGMGTVYLARHTLLGREAAIKVLLPECSNNPEIVERFFNEARAATAIRHPGIVEVYDFGYHDGNQAFIVMEYLRGESLDARIKRAGRLPEDQALAITRQIAGALAAAHSAGIIHRDLKPDNIFLVRDPEVLGGERIRLLDFGIAKLTGSSQSSGSHTRTGALMGTPTYMSPEQCTGAGNVDARTDLYALGCILFRMLCGRPPFGGQGVGAVMAAHIYEQPPMPSSLAPVSPDVEGLILRLLAKPLHERFQRAEDVIEAIGNLASAPPHIRATTQPRVGSGPGIEQVAYAAGTVGERSKSTLGSVFGEVATAAPHSPWLRRTLIAASFALLAGVGIAWAVVRGADFTPRDLAPADVTPAVSPSAATPASVGAGDGASDIDEPAKSASPPAEAAAVQNRAEAAGGEPAMIAVEIQSQPPGALVFRKFDGILVGTTPYRGELQGIQGKLVYTLRLDGHRDEELIIPANEGGTYSVTLQATKGTASRSKTRRGGPGKQDGQRALAPFEKQGTPKQTGPLDPFEKPEGH
jgi:tRNA A-37 threonylcarbamoyl transferase component Bud32